ncbi:MAG: SUMF1/EgtB/PvdO family nonheme iron enzyme [Deltaproteobacteria bacterium]|nr:SUMF1/EgtB/PvdO family nonheme iron enzyme [Deltaproteobacteria bacterium]
MVTINRTSQFFTLPSHNPLQQPVEASLPNISPSHFPHLSQALGALHEIKHSIFSSLYSSVGSGLCARPTLEFLDHEIFTESFALQLGIAVAAGIPAGFAGRAAGQGLIAFVGNNALGRVAAFCIRIPVTHLVNQYLSGSIQANLSHQAYVAPDFEAQDLLSVGNLGAAEVLGHTLGGSTGSFILGRLIGGATNCLATGLEIFAGHQINKISRQILHRNLFEAVEQREIRDALNWRELIKNTVMDTAFCAGHGVLGFGAHLLRRVGPPCPTANRNGRPQRAAPTVESPTPRDFIEFARQTPGIARQTRWMTLMLAMGTVGGGARSRPRTTFELEGLKAHLEHARNRLAAAERRGDERDQGTSRVVICALEHEIAGLEAETVQALAKAHPVASLMSLVSVKGGRFRMGGEDVGAYDDESPVQEITLPGFEVTETVVTNRVFELYREAMQDRPFAIIATERENPYCWVIGRFASDEEARKYVGEGSKGNIDEIIESESAGNNPRAYEFFSQRRFVTGFKGVNLEDNPNGLQIVRGVPESYRREKNFDRPNQPATEVDWFEALGCADWLGRALRSGLPGRLSAAAESEFLRRGGIDPKTGTCRNNNYGTSDGNPPNGSNADFARPYDEGPKDVDAVPVSPLGVRINGVWEWCNGWYGNSLEGLAETTAGFLNPKTFGRELRGVSWFSDNAGYARAASREGHRPNERSDRIDIGFRAVVVPQD